MREALDCGTEFPTCSPHAIAEALTTFLMALPDPIVKSELIPPVPFTLHFLIDFLVSCVCVCFFICYLSNSRR